MTKGGINEIDNWFNFDFTDFMIFDSIYFFEIDKNRFEIDFFILIFSGIQKFENLKTKKNNDFVFQNDGK